MKFSEEVFLGQKAKAEGESLYGGQVGLYLQEFFLLDGKVVRVSTYRTTETTGAPRGEYYSLERLREEYLPKDWLWVGLQLALEKRGIAFWS